MNRRKHISWKTKCAAALVHCNIIPREEAKLLEEDQLLSLFHWDHNEFYTLDSTGRDKFWNLTPMLIRAHRQKTKTDAKIIAKGKRIRARLRDAAGTGNHVARLRPAPLRTDPDEAGGGNCRAPSIRPLSGSHKLKSRGFDKRLRRKIDGTIVKRQGD